MEKKASAYYFTGTGNSLRVLTLSKDVLGKNGFSVTIEPIVNHPSVRMDSDLYLFSFPVYSLALPRIALKFLKDLPVMESPKKAALFVTGGDPDDAGWTLKEGREILEKKGFHVACTDLFTMPDNWLPFDDVPGPEEAKNMLEKAETAVRKTMNSLLNGEERHKPFNVKKFGYLPSLLLYFLFRNLGVKRLWKFFRANADCDGCGVCAKACPTKSIAMSGKHPKWSKTCEQCMRCINVCHKKAIEQLEFIGKGSKRNRYLEPHFRPLSD